MIQQRFFSLLSLFIAGAVTGAVFAHDVGGVSPAPADGSEGEHRRHHRRHSPIKAALDANHDRAIDANEIAGAPAALKALDLNGDGMLTADEIRPRRHKPAEANGSAPAVQNTPNAEGDPPAANNRKPRRQRPLVAALDPNHDGIIDTNEIANASRELAQLDKNGDGKLSRDDFHKPHGEPQAGGENPAPAR